MKYFSILEDKFGISIGHVIILYVLHAIEKKKQFAR